MRKEEHISKLNNFYTSALRAYEFYRPQFNQLLDIYKGALNQEIVNDLESRGKSHLAYKKAKALVNRYCAGVKSTYFTNDTFANILSYDSDEESEKIARARQKSFDFHWKHTIKPYKAFSECILDSGIYGTPICKVYYDVDEDTPKLERVSIHDIYFDPEAINIEDCRFIIHKYSKTKQDIKELKRLRIFNLNFDIESLSYENQNSNEHSRIDLIDIYFQDKNKWYVSTLNDMQTLLRMNIELKDGQPFIVGSIMEQSYDDRDEYIVRIYSDTFLSSIDTLQQEITARINQNLDSIDININPKYFAQDDAGLDQNDLKFGAGKVVSVINKDSLAMIPPPPINTLDNQVDRISLQMEESTGIRSLLNQESSLINRQTAYGMEVLSNEGNVMLDSYIRSFNETFAEPLIERLVKLIWKYSRNNFLFEGVNRSSSTRFFVSINAGLGATSKSVQIQGNDRLFAQFLQIQDMENARRVIKDTLPLYGKKNISMYFPDDEMSKEERQKMQEQAQAKQDEEDAIMKQKVELEMRDMQAKIAKLNAEAQKIMAELSMRQQELMLEERRVMSEIEIKNRELLLKEDEADEKRYLLENKQEPSLFTPEQLQ